jgi:predicted hydrocarbon binding protein
MVKNVEPKYGRKKPRLEDFSREELLEMAFGGMMGAESLVMAFGLLISAIGKEEAKKLIKKARHNLVYRIGRSAGEKLENPKDLDSLLENFLMKSPPWVGLRPLVFSYRTEKKAVLRNEKFCFIAEAIKKHADKEMQEFFADCFCVHDQAWTNGFNPEIKFQQTKSFLKGDDCCEFVFEME